MVPECARSMREWKTAARLLSSSPHKAVITLTGAKREDVNMVTSPTVVDAE